MKDLDIGIIGLGVMGQNLALNIADKGFTVGGWDAWPEPVERLGGQGGDGRRARLQGAARSAGRRCAARAASSCWSRRARWSTRPSPRCGRSSRRATCSSTAATSTSANTERRADRAGRARPALLRHGRLGRRGGRAPRPVADAGRRPRRLRRPGADPRPRSPRRSRTGRASPTCGPGGAGHYVKMVHNGIEYGDMQLIAEAYDLLQQRRRPRRTPSSPTTFDEWNQGELQSLPDRDHRAASSARRIPDTGRRPRRPDPRRGRRRAPASGRCRTPPSWARRSRPSPRRSRRACCRPTARARLETSKLLRGPSPVALSPSDKQGSSSTTCARALYAAKACAYAQGMNLLRVASRVRNWNLDLGELARIWKGGCIIRAQFLGRIQAAYERDAEPAEPAARSRVLARSWRARQDGWRRVVGARVGRRRPDARRRPRRSATTTASAASACRRT